MKDFGFATPTTSDLNCDGVVELEKIVRLDNSPGENFYAIELCSKAIVDKINAAIGQTRGLSRNECFPPCAYITQYDTFPSLERCSSSDADRLTFRYVGWSGVDGINQCSASIVTGLRLCR